MLQQAMLQLAPFQLRQLPLRQSALSPFQSPYLGGVPGAGAYFSPGAAALMQQHVLGHPHHHQQQHCSQAHVPHHLYDDNNRRGCRDSHSHSCSGLSSPFGRRSRSRSRSRDRTRDRSRSRSQRRRHSRSRSRSSRDYFNTRHHDWASSSSYSDSIRLPISNHTMNGMGYQGGSISVGRDSSIFEMYRELTFNEPYLEVRVELRNGDRYRLRDVGSTRDLRRNERDIERLVVVEAHLV